MLLAPLRGGEIEITFNEVHYHPGDDSRDGEFIELFNYGPDAIDLSDWQIRGAVLMNFPSGTSIDAGSHLVVGRDAVTVLDRYDLSIEQYAGSYVGSLDNDGERLELWNADGYLISSVAYDDADPWPETPDGLGPSLERVSPGFEDADPRAREASILVDHLYG